MSEGSTLDGRSLKHGLLYERLRDFQLSIAITMLAGLASNAAAQSMTPAQLEMLDWLYPERALQIVDAAPASPPDSDPSRVEMLEIRGTVFSNNNRQEAARDVLNRLDAIARSGDPAAVRAAHYVRAYLVSAQGQFRLAESEIKSLDLGPAATDVERYRIGTFQGYLWRMLGKAEAALPALARSLDLATKMHDDLRILSALLAVGRAYMDSGDFDRASAEAAAARRLATRLGAEGALSDIYDFMADIAGRRGDHAAELRASLEALEHARRSGSKKWLSMMLVALSDSYLSSGDYAQALKYAKEGLPLMIERNDVTDVQSTLFDEGLAYIGLGNLATGQRLAEGAIARTLAGGDLMDGRDLLREYERALERAGYLTMALEVYHRYTETNEKFMTHERQRTFLELSAQFDDERKVAELEILRRDSAIKASKVREQQLELAKVKAESTAANADASRATLARDVAIYVALSLLVGIVTAAWALRRRHDLAQGRKASAERLAALGRLTGGIAHEFNNQLTVVQQALGLLAGKSYLTTDPEGGALIEELKDSSRSLAETTAQLQSFSRQQNLRPQAIPLAPFLHSKRTVLERTAGSSATIQTNIENDAVSVWVDERQLLSALINLVANARDAMGATGSIVIDVATADQEFTRISVIDKGVGMDVETLSRAAEPFFSTKPLGAGTGLGLSMVDGFVRQSGGRLSLSSEVARGTTASMILPRSAQSLHKSVISIIGDP
jgi:signal transduction histidine kinase